MDLASGTRGDSDTSDSEDEERRSTAVVDAKAADSQPEQIDREDAPKPKRAKHNRRGSGRAHNSVARAAQKPPAVTPLISSKSFDSGLNAMMATATRFFEGQDEASINSTSKSSSSSSSSNNSSNNSNGNNYTFRETMALEELKGRNLQLQHQVLMLQQKNDA